MINQVYRLVSPRQFEISYMDHAVNSNCVVVRPTHLSICAADQRYYTGSRGKEALAKKLPMALVHEGIGEIVFDPEKKIKIGSKVVMIPNTPIENDEVIKENYLRTSKFRSSGFDGFMQDYVFMERDRLVVLPDDLNTNVAAFIELITISMHALTRFQEKAHKRCDTFGVWGDGNLGFITSLVLKKLYKNSKVIVFGKTPWKLDNFSFVDEIYQINEIPADLRIDHAFECVGGKGSQYAIEQIIAHTHPEAVVSILGVSEYPIEINTRMVLEKGLMIIGSSRSGRADFVKTVEFLDDFSDVIEYLTTLVGKVIEVKSIQDIVKAFEFDLSSSWGKTVMEWKI